MTQKKLLACNDCLGKTIQFGWLRTSISLFPSQLVEIGIDQITDYDGS